MFSDDLKAKLKENHMTQTELAKYLNVGQTAVSSWTRGAAKPRTREFNMICDLFDLKVEHYTAERNGIVEKKEEPKVVGAFHPKHYVRPEVKEKVDLSENPYKKAKEKGESYRCDMEIKKLKESLDDLAYKFTEFTKVVGKDMDTLTDEIVKKDQQIAELNEKIIYMRGMIDGSNTDKSELEGKSWWQRLWE